MKLKIEIEAETYEDLATILGQVRDNIIIFCVKRGIDGSDEISETFGMQENDDIDFNNWAGTFEIVGISE